MCRLQLPHLIMCHMVFKSAIFECYVGVGYLNHIAGSINKWTFTNVCISNTTSYGTCSRNRGRLPLVEELSKTERGLQSRSALTE